MYVEVYLCVCGGVCVGGCADLASVVVYDEPLVPAVEVLVCVDADPQLLQERLVRALPLGMHGGTHVVKDTHDARGILGTTFPSESVCTTYL